MAGEMDFAMVVLHYGDPGLTGNCLRSLTGSGVPVYLVENCPEHAFDEAEI